MPSLQKNWIDGEKTWLPCGGNLNICPHLYQLELPCHSQTEFTSISSLKVWGNVQKPCHNIAYLLVWVENTMKDRQYGISLVWVNTNQIRAATVEEAVEKFNFLLLQWDLLALCPSTTVQGPLPCTTSQGQTPGHPTSGKGGGNPLWADQPTQSLPTPCHWPTSHLSHRFEWT